MDLLTICSVLELGKKNSISGITETTFAFVYMAGLSLSPSHLRKSVPFDQTRTPSIPPFDQAVLIATIEDLLTLINTLMTLRHAALQSATFFADGNGHLVQFGILPSPVHPRTHRNPGGPEFINIDRRNRGHG